MESVAQYFRVSSISQSEKYGLSVQRSMIDDYVKVNKYRVVKTYEDAGVTGTIIERPALLELLDDAKKGLFKKVLVARYCRLARDLYVQLWIEKELKKYDVEIISTSEPYTSNANADPMTQAFRQIIGVFAMLEKNIIVARLRAGRHQKAVTDGAKHVGTCAFGYAIEQGAYSVQQDEAAVVRKIFQMFNDGKSIGAIVRYLRSEGFKTKNDKEFQSNTVKAILQNQNYIGKIQHEGKFIQGSHEPIISKIMFGKARKRFEGK